MSFLQTAGIASQASDAFDADRQAMRLAGQREKIQQNAIDDDALYRQIVQLAYAHERAREAAKAKPKGAVEMPTAPTAPNMNTASNGFEADVQQMANGGPVTAEKFSGIYDDTKVVDRMPTGLAESMNDWDQPHYMHGHHYHEAVHDLVTHVNRLANGGSVSGDMYNGVQLYANGGGVERIEKAKPGEITKGIPDDKPAPSDEADIENAKPGSIKKGVEDESNPLRRFLDERLGGKKDAPKKMKGGGAVRGPGTSTSDSVPAKGPGGKPFALSNGEYVLSADTVRAVGKPNLDKLQSQYHKKV